MEQLSKSALREKKHCKTDFFSKSRTPLYIVLDSLKVAFNVGTILRLSDALMVEKVFICGNTIIPPNKKIKTSSRGAERWVPWEYREDVVELIKELKSNGSMIVSAEIANNSEHYKNIEYKAPVAIVLGREFDGVNAEVLKLSDKVVHLPMLGMSNSINVSETAGILMYEIYDKIVKKRD